MATLDMTAFDAVLKDHYTPEKVRELSAYNNPLFAMIRKKKAGGKKYIQPVEFQKPGGGSATFSTAKTNQTVSKYEDFQLTRKKRYQLVTIDNETIEASADNPDAFLSAFDEFDRGFKGFGEVVNSQIYRTGGGSIGRIASSTTLTGPTIVLTDPADAFNFYIGQKVVLSDADGTGTIRDSSDTLEVTDIDRENGEITVAENINTVSGAAANDFIFTEGDHGACISGLASWLPTDRSGLGTTFFSVDRSQDEERLAGIYMDGTGMALDEVLIKLVARIGKHGGQPNWLLMNPETLSDMMLLWNSKGVVMQPVKTELTPTIGFKGFEVNVGGQDVTIYKDRSCPSSRVYALQSDTWTLWHTGPMPGFLNEKAGSILRVVEDADSYETRIGAYMQLGCSAPGWNGVAAI
jgi:hypothetical protein